MKIRPMCSFCDKSHLEVSRLISGPGVYICDECVGLCAEIVAGEAERLERVLRVRGFVTKLAAIRERDQNTS